MQCIFVQDNLFLKFVKDLQIFFVKDSSLRETKKNPLEKN